MRLANSILAIAMTFVQLTTAACSQEPCCDEVEGSFPVLSGPYLGQTPPGLVPEVFGEGVVSTGMNELNSVFSKDGTEFYPSFSADGTIYFQSRRPGGPGPGDIYRSRLVDGEYREAELLPAPINTEESEGDALIAPDGRYFFFTSRRAEGVPGQRESYDELHERWTAPAFGHSHGDIYWVDAALIETLRP
jgi:hypothetical protein